MLIDYHVHPDFSIDALGTIDEYCIKAIELGIKEICFTTHFETDPKRSHIDGFARIKGRLVPITSSWWDFYFSDIEEARVKYGKYLIIKAGAEVDFVPEKKQIIYDVIKGYDFDYILLGIHTLEHIGFSSKSECEQIFSKKTSDKIFKDYWQIVNEALEWEIFDGIAHLDLYERYGKNYYGTTLHQENGLLIKVLKKIAQRGLVVEINTSGLRGPLACTMPSEVLLRLCIANGIRNFTLGSDSHRLEHLGVGLEEGTRLLKSSGITEICTFKKRTLIKVAI